MTNSSIDSYLNLLKSSPVFAENIPYWSFKQETTAKCLSIPEEIEPEVRELLKRIGISSLYSHQVEAITSSDVREVLF